MHAISAKNFEMLSYIRCESKKSPPEDLWQFFQNGLEFFNQILLAYYAFLSMLDYEFLFSYLNFDGVIPY